MEKEGLRWSPTTKRDFLKCNRMVFYNKIQKLEKKESDYAFYGNGGTAMHSAIEEYYNSGRNLNKAQLMFNNLWDEFKLGEKLDKKVYWEGVLWTIELNLIPTTCEMNILLLDPFKYVTYIDAINTHEDWIINYKSSTYKASKVREGKQQMLTEAYGYYKKFGRIPKKEYLIFSKEKRKFEFEFTKEEILKEEQDIKDCDSLVATFTSHVHWKVTDDEKNCYWCGFKDVCKKDPFGLGAGLIERMNFTIILKDNYLYLEGPMTPLLEAGLKKELNYAVKNAFFVRKAISKKGRFWDGIVELWNTRYNRTNIGFLQRVKKILVQYGQYIKKEVIIEIREKRDAAVLNTKLPDYPNELNFSGVLYDHQEEAIKRSMEKFMGIIQAPTGSGKTLIAAELLRRIKGKALFVIDNKDLLFQTVATYEKYLGPIVGVVGAGSKDFSKPITCATIQTLHKHLKAFQKELYKINVVLFDETHIIAADSFKKLCAYLPNTKYRIGTSATPYRDDGNEKLIYANCGDVIYKVELNDMIEKEILVRPISYFYKLDEKAITNTDSWHDEYLEVIENNEERNQKIVEIIDFLKKDQILVLAKHINHCKKLQTMIPGSELIFGATEDVIRKEVIQRFKNKEFRVLVGNIAIFNKGIDIPSLDTLFNVAGNKAQVMTVQSIGRALRTHEGKTKAKYIDFYDYGQYMGGASRSRYVALKEFGYDVRLLGQIKDIETE